MTAPGRPNSPEREAWCREQKRIADLRRSVVVHESAAADLQRRLDRARQQLAEAEGRRNVMRHCYIDCQDFPIVDGSSKIPERLDELEGYALIPKRIFDKIKGAYDAESERQKLAQPDPDPEVEAVADVVHDVLKECFERFASRGPGTYEENCSDFARIIIAALDAARAERRAKAQDARVEAARSELVEILLTMEAAMRTGGTFWHRDFRRDAERILAAADAAQEGEK